MHHPINPPASFDHVPETYWADAYSSDAHKQMWHREFPSAELVATTMALGLKPPCNVIDLGCGAGSESLFMARCGFNTTGIDLSPTAIEQAKQRAATEGLAARFIQGDVLDLPFEDSSVDFANDRACFHHIRMEDRPCYVSEIARVLRPGARILLRVCDVVSSSQTGTTPESLEVLFDSNRFQIEGARPFSFDAISSWLPAMLALIRRR